MRENGMHIDLVRAGRANLFLSDVFTQSFASINNLAVEFYEGDGSFGAALGAAVGAGIYKDVHEMGSKRQPVRILEPTVSGKLESNYQQWKTALLDSLRKMEEQRELVSDVS
jgi:xylulokinase